MRNYIEEFVREMNNRNYAWNTIRVYSGHLKHFLTFSRKSDFEPAKRIAVFLEKKSSLEQRRLAWASIKLFYKLVLGKECPYQLDRIRSRKRLPDILTKNEILNILGHITNEKHRLMISLLYGSGLRVSEVCNVRIKDLNCSNLTLKISNSKGNKDRVTLLSAKSAKDLQKIITGRGSDENIFLTLHKRKYSIRTVQKIFSNALEKTGLTKKPTCHTLRHCFATHLLESGTDLKTIKDLLGHQSVNTTMIYVQLAKPDLEHVKSPL